MARRRRRRPAREGRVEVGVGGADREGPARRHERVEDRTQEHGVARRGRLVGGPHDRPRAEGDRRQRAVHERVREVDEGGHREHEVARAGERRGRLAGGEQRHQVRAPARVTRDLGGEERHQHHVGEAEREPEAERGRWHRREAERAAGGVEHAERAVGEEEEDEPGGGEGDRQPCEEKAERREDAVRHGRRHGTPGLAVASTGRG